jgi:hypothetical protein
VRGPTRARLRCVAGAVAINPFNAPKVAGIVHVSGDSRISRPLVCHGPATFRYVSFRETIKARLAALVWCIHRLGETSHADHIRPLTTFARPIAGSLCTHPVASVFTGKCDGKLPKSDGMHTRLQIPGHNPNLSRRPLKPAAARGRVQRQCRRCLLTYGGSVSTTTAIAWSFRALTWGAPSKNDFNRSVRRALESLGCVKVVRSAVVVEAA